MNKTDRLLIYLLFHYAYINRRTRHRSLRIINLLLTRDNLQFYIRSC